MPVCIQMDVYTTYVSIYICKTHTHTHERQNTKRGLEPWIWPKVGPVTKAGQGGARYGIPGALGPESDRRSN